MIISTLFWTTVFVAAGLIHTCSGDVFCSAWSACTVRCGGGTQTRTCIDNIHHFSYPDKQDCNQTCDYGFSFQHGKCDCPAHRTGSCCETCVSTNITHCHDGSVHCGGSPDGIMCTQCHDTYYSGGYHAGCKACQSIDHCMPGHNICHGPSSTDTICRECEPGYYSGGYGGGCIECTHVPHCKRHFCTNGTFSHCLECDVHYWLINNGTAERFCFSLARTPHVECERGGPCIVVFETAVPWEQARDVCLARKGHLFVPTSKQEEDVMRNFVATIKDFQFHIGMYWIGGQVLPTDSRHLDIEWVHQTIDGIDRWGFPVPSPPRGNEPPTCVGLDDNDGLLWNTYDCSSPGYFVCEESQLYIEYLNYVG